MVGFRVLFDQGLRNPKCYSFESSELIISSSCWLELRELKELVVQHINPKIEQSSNGYALIGFCWSTRGLGFCLINV
jgi:hypothetical protein